MPVESREIGDVADGHAFEKFENIAGKAPRIALSFGSEGGFLDEHAPAVAAAVSLDAKVEER